MSQEPSPTDPTDAVPQRVSPITFPSTDLVLPKPGETDPQTVRDAYRETSFALRPDMNWLVKALKLQRAIVAASYPSKYRNHRYGAALLLWSRIYTTGIDLLRMTASGSYASAAPLLRAQLEWLGAEQAVVGSEYVDYESWLRDAFQPDPEFGATAIGMGQYMAGQQIAGADDLSEIYRAASELARPHFGASALLAAPESNVQKIAINWGDQSFHLGWAQILFGWEMVVQDRQLRFAIGRDLFAVEAEMRESYHKLHRELESLLSARDRCRTEWAAKDGRQRLLIHSFRRQPGGAPKELLL